MSENTWINSLLRLSKYLYLIVLYLAVNSAWAGCGRFYLYLENPDPNKYIIMQNEFNYMCPIEISKSGHETIGFISEGGRADAIAYLIDRNTNIPVLKYIVECTPSRIRCLGACNKQEDITSHTAWVTLAGHSTHRTWTCDNPHKNIDLSETNK